MAETKKVTPNMDAPEPEVKQDATAEQSQEPAVQEVKKKKRDKSRVKIFIPIDPLNPGVNYWYCNINGQDYYIARGKEVEVDWGVADLYRRTVQREQDNRGMVKVTEIAGR